VFVGAQHVEEFVVLELEALHKVFVPERQKLLLLLILLELLEDACENLVRIQRI